MINNYQQGVDLIKGLHATYIDANAQIMSVSQGLGPFIMYPNEYLRAFARDEGMSVADWSDGEKRQALRRYFRMYARHYSRRWIMEPWEECEIGLMAEAYDDSYRDFGAWLSGGRPITYDFLLLPYLYRLRRLRTERVALLLEEEPEEEARLTLAFFVEDLFLVEVRFERTDFFSSA